MVGAMGHCKVEIKRRLDATVVFMHGYCYGDKKYHVPSTVSVFYPNGESEVWNNSDEYRKVLDADLVQEIDTQIPLMYLVLA